MGRQSIELSHLLLIIVSSLLVLTSSILGIYASQSPWPTEWILIDLDKNEDGTQDDWRDVKYAYYNFDSSYLYLRLECYDQPGKDWPHRKGARYKWFIDLDGNLYVSGGNVIEAEYVLFVEDTDDNGVGELYLLLDQDDNGDFNEYGPWPPANYHLYKITDPNIGGWRIIGNYIDMYISWSKLGNPSSYGLYWTTDQENPNLNQAPTTDRRDEETLIVIRDVVALSQSVNATEVVQGDIVEITVVVSNRGMRSESFDVTCYFYPTIIETKRVENLPIGYSETLTFLWNTSTVEPGTYEIRAFVDSSGEILEIDEGNNWCTAEARVTVKVHDVAALSQSVNATIVTQGEIVEVEVVVKNLGDFIESFDVTCYYDNTQIGSPQRVENLAPKEERMIKFYWDTSNVDPGVYFIKAFADSGREIMESDEDNNNCTMITPVTVVAPGLPGILDVDKVLIRVVEGPSPAVVGRETIYEILITVANTGGSTIENVNVTDTINKGEISGVGTPSLGEIRSWNSTTIVWYVGDLGMGKSAYLTFNIRFKPGESGIHILNYGDKLVAEGKDVEKDTGDRDIVVTAVTRDVAATSQKPLKYVVIKGELIGIDVVVKNLGDYYSETFDVTCYYDDTPIQPISVVRVLNLEPGGERTVRFVWDTSNVDPGVYFIKAFADSGREIMESDEDNNNCTSTEYVRIIIHDIAAVSQIPDPTRVVQGESVTIRVTVRNEGTEYESFTLKCYYYNETAEIPIELGEKSISLDPGSEETVYFIWDTTGIPPAVYYIEAHAIPVEGELDTDDNTCMSLANVTIMVARVSGYKWNDIDGDGEWDVAEPPLQNWNITLYKLVDSSWVYQTSVLTDEDGYYEFTDLAAGTYRVCEVLEDGWICTYPPDGYYEFTVTVDFDGADRNFGNFKKATIIVWKYEDMDGDLDTIDDWIPIDWSITLFNDTYPSGQSFDLGSSGMIIFSGQGPGIVTIVEGDAPGWIHMNATNTWTQSMESGGIYTVRFINTRMRGQIIVRKVTVSGDQSFEFTTSYSTNFLLSNGQENASRPLIPGNYTVTELPVDGWSLTSISIEDPDGGSSYDLATGTATIDLDAGETVYVTFTNTKHIPPPVGGVVVVQIPLKILIAIVATIVAIATASVVVFKKLRAG